MLKGDNAPDERFNQEIANGLAGASEKLPVTYQLLLGTTAATMRSRYGGSPAGPTFAERPIRHLLQRASRGT